MSSYTIISPSENLIDEVLARLPHGTHDYSNSIIVFPGKRPAHFLRKSLAEHLKASFFPPQIFSIDTFIEHLYSSKLGMNKPRLEVIDAVAILFETHLTIDEQVGKDKYQTLESFFPIGIKLFAELEEIVLANLSDRRIREVLSSLKFEKFHSFSDYYEKFYPEIERRGYTTRSLSYRKVAEQIRTIDFSSYQQILLAGFYAFTNVEKNIFLELRKRDNVTFIFQQGKGLAQQLAGINITVDEREFTISETPEVSFTKAPDTHGQVFALAAKLNRQKTSGEPLDHSTAIILPSSEALFPVVHFGLSILPEKKYNIALGYPLSRTPVYGFLKSLMDLIGSMHQGKFSSKEYLKLVLHPYTKNIRFHHRSDITRILFHALEERILEKRSKMLFSLDELENDLLFFAELQKKIAGVFEGTTSEMFREHLVKIHQNTIRRFMTFSSVEQFSQAGMDVLMYIYEHSTANLHPYFRPFVQRMVEVFDALKHSLLATHSFTEPRAYFSFFQSIIEQESVPFQGTPVQGVQVLGLLETRNLQFATLYILDANDDVIPGKRNDDLLLPQQLRAMLGLDTHQDRERLIEYYFDLAVHGAKRVHLFYTESTQKEKSRFVEKLLWQFQKRDKKTDTLDYEEKARYHVHLTNTRPEPITKTEKMLAHLRRNIKFSAKSLDTYLDCPLKFYYQSVLRLSEKEEASDDMDAQDVGKLVHAILKEYFEPYIASVLKKEHIQRERLEQVVDSFIQDEFGKELTGMALLLRRQVKLQLWQFLEKYQLQLLEQQKIVIEAVEYPIEVEKSGFCFSGIIDRIEKRNGRTHILDYKTGSNEKSVAVRLDKLDANDSSTWHDGIQSFQMPLYMLLYSEKMKTPMSDIAPTFLFLGRNTINQDIEVGINDDEHTAAEVYQAIEPIMFKIIEEIFNPEIPFEPTRSLEEQCPRCPYIALCGTKWVKGKEY
jgi:CRISPR/Cas system-associated exonuclease Cas4 (RecB family)